MNSKSCYTILEIYLIHITNRLLLITNVSTVKLGNKELFDKEQIGIKEPFLVTNFTFSS